MASTHQAGALYNSLTAGSKIIGTVVADSDFRIDGVVEGDVQCKGRVVLGDHGIIKGDLTCQNADIMGTINGSLHVENTLSLRATGSITGDVKTQVLVIEPKAQFNGSCSMAQESGTPDSGKPTAKGEKATEKAKKVEEPKAKVEAKVEVKTLADKRREQEALKKANEEAKAEIKVEDKMENKVEEIKVEEPELQIEDDVIAVFDDPEIIVEA